MEDGLNATANAITMNGASFNFFLYLFVEQSFTWGQVCSYCIGANYSITYSLIPIYYPKL